MTDFSELLLRGQREMWLALTGLGGAPGGEREEGTPGGARPERPEALALRHGLERRSFAETRRERRKAFPLYTNEITPQTYRRAAERDGAPLSARRRTHGGEELIFRGDYSPPGADLSETARHGVTPPGLAAPGRPAGFAQRENEERPAGSGDAPALARALSDEMELDCLRYDRFRKE